jgi:hypothetical protein
MSATEWLPEILAFSGSLAALTRLVAARSEKRHLRCIDACISCPKTAANVECTLVRDGRTGVYKAVESCSGNCEGSQPTCEQDCVWFLNLGIPLRPRATEEIEGSSPEEADAPAP